MEQEEQEEQEDQASRYRLHTFNFLSEVSNPISPMKMIRFPVRTGFASKVSPNRCFCVSGFDNKSSAIILLVTLITL